MDWKLVSAPGHRLVSCPTYPKTGFFGQYKLKTSEGLFITMLYKKTASFEYDFETHWLALTVRTVEMKMMAVETLS